MATHAMRMDAMLRDSELSVVRALRDAAMMSLTDLTQVTGLSRPTLSAALDRLSDRGLVDTDARDSSDRRAQRTGRPAREYRFAADAAYVVGIDARADRILVGIADLDGKVVALSENPDTGHLDGAARVRAISQLVRYAARQSSIAPQRIRCAVIAVPGVVSPDGRVLISTDFSDWQGLDVAELISAELNCEVVLDTDVKLAALAEHRMGAAQLAQDLIYFHVGSRVAAGIIIDGSLRRGRHNTAGELSGPNLRLPLAPDGRIRWTTDIDGRSVLQASEAGDPAAAMEIKAIIDGLAEMISSLAQAIDPDCVVIGGPLARAGESLLEPLRTAVALRNGIPISWNLIASGLGDDVKVRGALSHAFDRVSQTVFGIDGVPAPKVTFAVGGDSPQESPPTARRPAVAESV